MYIKLQAAGGVLVANTKQRTLEFRPLSEGERDSTVGFRKHNQKYTTPKVSF